MKTPKEKSGAPKTNFMQANDKKDGSQERRRENEDSTWWTPEGFVFRGAPPAFLAALEDPSGGGDWCKMLADAGYERFADYKQSGELPYGFEVQVYDHRAEAHLLVDISNWDRGLSEFFVAKQHKNLFFATWYVEFVRSVAQIEQAHEVATIAKSLVAFVRHGHGTRTIDEDGEESRDDVERRALLRRPTAGSYGH